MNRIYSLLLASIASLVLSSCHKEPVKNVPPGGNTGALNQISRVQTGQYVTSIVYNTDTTVKAIHFTDNTSDIRDSILFYYQNNKLVKAEEPAYRFVYNYEGNHVSSIIFSDKKDHPYHHYKFKYAGDDIIETITDIQQNGELKPYVRNLYSYSTPGNESKGEYFMYDNGNWRKIAEKRTTLRDNHQNCSSWLDTYPFLLATRNRGNNPIHEEYLDVNGIPYRVIEYAYTYDAMGKPISIKTTTTEEGRPAVVTTSTLSYL